MSGTIPATVDAQLEMPEALDMVARHASGRALHGFVEEAFENCDLQALEALRCHGRLTITAEDLEEIALGGGAARRMPMCCAIVDAAMGLMASARLQSKPCASPYPSQRGAWARQWLVLDVDPAFCQWVEELMLQLLHDLDQLVHAPPHDPDHRHPGADWDIAAATRSMMVAVAGMIDSPRLMGAALRGLTPMWIENEILGFQYRDERVAPALGFGAGYREISVGVLYWAFAFSSHRALDEALTLFPNALDQVVRVGALGGESHTISAWSYLAKLGNPHAVSTQTFMAWWRHQTRFAGVIRPQAKQIFDNDIGPQLHIGAWFHLVPAVLETGALDHDPAHWLQQALHTANTPLIEHFIAQGAVQLPLTQAVQWGDGTLVQAFGAEHPLSKLVAGMQASDWFDVIEAQAAFDAVVRYMVEQEREVELRQPWLHDGTSLASFCAVRGMRSTLALLCQAGLDPAVHGLVRIAEGRGHVELAADLRSICARGQARQALDELLKGVPAGEAG